MGHGALIALRSPDQVMPRCRICGMGSALFRQNQLKFSFSRVKSESFGHRHHPILWEWRTGIQSRKTRGQENSEPQQGGKL
jgi:ribosomal protein S14